MLILTFYSVTLYAVNLLKEILLSLHQLVCTRWHFDMEFLEAFMVLDNRVLRFMLWIIKVFLPWFIAISSGILKRTLTFVLRSYEFIHPQYQLLNLTPLILFQIIYFYCSFVLSGYMHANFGFMIIYEIVVPCTFLP